MSALVVEDTNSRNSSLYPPTNAFSNNAIRQDGSERGCHHVQHIRARGICPSQPSGAGTCQMSPRLARYQPNNLGLEESEATCVRRTYFDLSTHDIRIVAEPPDNPPKARQTGRRAYAMLCPFFFTIASMAIPSPNIVMEFTFKINALLDLLRCGSRWEEMFVTQPPPLTIELDYRIESKDGPITGARTVKCVGGVRLRHLADEIRHALIRGQTAPTRGKGSNCYVTAIVKKIIADGETWVLRARR